jgi:hypothetical protein
VWLIIFFKSLQEILVQVKLLVGSIGFKVEQVELGRSRDPYIISSEGGITFDPNKSSPVSIALPSLLYEAGCRYV